MVRQEILKVARPSFQLFGTAHKSNLASNATSPNPNSARTTPIRV